MFMNKECVFVNECVCVCLTKMCLLMRSVCLLIKNVCLLTKNVFC